VTAKAGPLCAWSRVLFRCGWLPTGTITFRVNGVAQSPVTVSSAGRATLPLAGLSAGTSEVTAAYSGDGSFGGSTSTAFDQVVSRAKTTTTLVSSKNPVKVGGAGTLTATVKSVAPGTGVPTGTVTFTVDGAALAPVGVSVAGVAEILLSTLTTGTHTVTATYNGDANHTGSTSSTVNQVVTGAPGQQPMFALGMRRAQ
jgi:hypothetical protein